MVTPSGENQLMPSVPGTGHRDGTNVHIHVLGEVIID